MSLDKMTQSGLIHEFEDVSSGAHSSKFCFVLGAGASKTSGIKTGQELVDIWDVELKDRDETSYISWKKKNGITESNKYNFYSQYYEERFKKRPMDGLNFLEKMMAKVYPNVGYVVLAHLLAKTVHNVVITTNFDHLLEDALNYYEKSLPMVIGHESLAHYITEPITRPTIIKIHRDLLFDPKNTTKDVDNLDEAWEKGLDIVFSEFHPIFIGYAGNDKSLMDYLIKNKEKFISHKWKFPYWTLYKSDNIPNGKVKDFLEESDGYYINCDGFDELMCLLGAKLGYQMPTEERFLKDTKIRYRKLWEAFDTIVKKSEQKQLEDVLENDEKQETIRAAVQRIRQLSFEQDYNKVITLHNKGIYNNKSEKIARNLVENEPDNARSHDILSITLDKMGKYGEAIEEERKAIKLEPQNAGYHYSLGKILQKTGRNKDAAIEYEKASSLEPNNIRYREKWERMRNKL